LRNGNLIVRRPRPECCVPLVLGTNGLLWRETRPHTAT